MKKSNIGWCAGAALVVSLLVGLWLLLESRGDRGAVTAGVPLTLPKLNQSSSVVQPKIYRSSSGGFVLSVEPSDIHGRHGASYEMRHGDEVNWSAQLPFTLIDVHLTDRGETVGYGYSQGLEGFGRTDGYGDVHIVILDSHGEVRLADSQKRVGSRFPHGLPTPVVKGMVIHEEFDFFFVRTNDPDRNQNKETWWSYQISTGTKIADAQPVPNLQDGQRDGFVIAAKPVAGTPLTLVHQYHYRSAYADRSTSDDGPFISENREQIGARFLLIDESSKVVWQLFLPNDYQVNGDENAEEQLRDRLLETGAIVRVDQPFQFDLFFAADHQRVSYKIGSEKPQWSVSETARSPMSVPHVEVPSTGNNDIQHPHRVVVDVPKKSLRH